MITHHKNCRSDYPEKEKDKPPQSTTEIDLEDGTGQVAIVCDDCGAFEIIKKGEKSNG